jgi:hypothetical protein
MLALTQRYEEAERARWDADAKEDGEGGGAADRLRTQ